MSVRTPDRPGHPSLTDDMIASYLRGRGDVATPAGLLAAARAQVLQPAGAAWPARAWGLAMTLTAVIVAVVVLTLPSRPSPTTPVAGPVAPARELVLAIYRSTITGNDVWLKPADPTTALPLDGVKQIHIFEPFTAHLSPDGRTLAVQTSTVYLTDTDGEHLQKDSGTFRLIDLESWTVRETPVTNLGLANDLTWTADSQALVWLTPTRAMGDPLGRDYRVMRWTVGSAAPEILVDLADPTFLPYEMRIVDDSLVLYGRSADASGEASGAPRVQVIDTTTARVVQDVELPEPRMADAMSRPVVIWDTPHDRLLVAATDSLMTVSLPGLEVAVQPIEGAGTTAEPGPSPTVGADREPSFEPRTVLRGSVSPDGDRLFLTGLTHSPAEGVLYAPAGLRVIDMRDGSLVAPFDPSIGQLTLSPTGDRMLVTTYPTDGVSYEGYQGDARILDPDSLEVLARIPGPDGAKNMNPEGMSISWDGRYGYLGSSIVTDDRHQKVQVVDLREGRVIATSDVDGEGPVIALFALGGSCWGVIGC